MADNILLDEGVNALVNAQANNVAVEIDSVVIGNDASSSIDPSDTSINGNQVFSGGASLIGVSTTGTDTIRFLITLDEGIGDFDVGNIVLFTSNNEAFMKMSLDTQVQKTASNLPSKIGNRLTFNAALVYNNVTSLVNVSILTQTDASLPDVQDVVSLPNAGVATYNAYLLQNHEHLGVPTLALKRNTDNTWFGIPIMDYLKSADFGILDGGVDADEHLVNTRRVRVGGFIHKHQPERNIDAGDLDMGGTQFNNDLDFENL